MYIIGSRKSGQSSGAEYMMSYRSPQVKLAGNIQEKSWKFEQKHLIIKLIGSTDLRIVTCIKNVLGMNVTIQLEFYKT